MNTIFRMFKKTPAANRLIFILPVVAGGLWWLSAQAQPVQYGASVVGEIKPYREGSGATMLTVRSDDCRQLQKYMPAPDVAYQPGVTSSGDHVAPADIGAASDFGKTGDLNFTFTVRLKNTLPSASAGSAATAASTVSSASDVLGEAPIGKVEFHNGVASFNGVPLGGEDLQALSAGCSSALKARGKGKKHK